MSQRAIVIGASAGGIEALKEVVRRLPESLPTPVFVVLHIPAYVASSLPRILSDAGPLRAVHPHDGMKFERGCIYVAPPDHHLLIALQHLPFHSAGTRGPQRRQPRAAGRRLSITAFAKRPRNTACSAGLMNLSLSSTMAVMPRVRQAHTIPPQPEPPPSPPHAPEPPPPTGPDVVPPEIDDPPAPDESEPVRDPGVHPPAVVAARYRH